MAYYSKRFDNDFIFTLNVVTNIEGFNPNNLPNEFRIEVTEGIYKYKQKVIFDKIEPSIIVTNSNINDYRNSTDYHLLNNGFQFLITSSGDFSCRILARGNNGTNDVGFYLPEIKITFMEGYNFITTECILPRVFTNKIKKLDPDEEDVLLSKTDNRSEYNYGILNTTGNLYLNNSNSTKYNKYNITDNGTNLESHSNPEQTPLYIRDLYVLIPEELTISHDYEYEGDTYTLHPLSIKTEKIHSYIQDNITGEKFQVNFTDNGEEVETITLFDYNNGEIVLTTDVVKHSFTQQIRTNNISKVAKNDLIFGVDY